MSRGRALRWLALPLLALAVCAPSTPRLLWACKTIAPGTPASTARASLAAAGAYCNDPPPEIWTTWAASPTCVCHVAEDRSGVVTRAVLGCGKAPADLEVACASVRVGDRLDDARKALDATGYPASQGPRAFACYVSFVACDVRVDRNDNVLGASVGRIRR